jgi:eukaryotic-like serine/threonine-protein kinase
MPKGDPQKAAGGGSAPQYDSGGLPGRIGKYRIDYVIGRGAVGVVYKGHDEQIDRPLAIKTLRPEILQDVGGNEEFLQRFAAEARSAGRCLHPNIVTVFDFVEHAGTPYIVMEYVDAGTLDNIIRSGVRLPIRQVGEILAQLLFALGHANSKGVIHRDVKPANILCPSAASIKVADFGVAHMEALDLTKPGRFSAVGTPNYMAPERFLGRPADARSDLFSAGVILFQLLTGAKPFIAADMPELMRKLMNEVPPSVQIYRPELSAEIDAVTQRALARNPEDRFQSAEEFVASLNHAIEARPVDNMPPLDLTELSRVPGKAPSGVGKERLSQTMAQKLAPGTIDALERSLARLLGPIARLFVKQATEQATSVDVLLATLMARIKTKAEAEAFRREAEQALRDDLGIATAQLEAVLSEAEVMAATEVLLKLIGPIARVLVARQARTAVGRIDFYRQLASAIPNEQERTLFLSIHAKPNPPHYADGRVPRA